MAWSVFLQVQLIEDGTLASIIPWSIISILFFIGFTFICLDTGFSISGYFDANDPSKLHNDALYVFLFIFCGLFVLFSVLVGLWVSGMFLRERRPLCKFIFKCSYLFYIVTDSLSHYACTLFFPQKQTKTVLYSGALFFFILSQAALWGLSQIVCINSNSKIDGSFLSTLCTIISVLFFYFAWKSVTEDAWDEVQTQSEYDGRPESSRYSQGPLLSTGQSGGTGGQSAYGTIASNNSGIHTSGPYMQQTSPLQSNYPYNDHRP